MTPTELELTNRWLKVYEEKNALYEENVRLKNECVQLKADYQSLKAAFEQKKSFLMQVLKDISDRDKKKNEIYYQVGMFKEKVRWLSERLSKCRRLFADDANKNNPYWPPLNLKEMPPLRLSLGEECPDDVDNDILSVFKQSSKGI